MSDYSGMVRSRLITEIETLQHDYAALWEKARSLQTECDEFVEDAERYRWLILHADEIYVHPDGYFGQNLSVDSFEAKKGDSVKIRVDAEIDAHMNSSPENPS